MDENTTACSQCSAEIPCDEAQLCEHCEMDGLGNCCIGDMDHNVPNGQELCANARAEEPVKKG